jgi:hypothetical protein
MLRASCYRSGAKERILTISSESPLLLQGAQRCTAAESRWYTWETRADAPPSPNRPHPPPASVSSTSSGHLHQPLATSLRLFHLLWPPAPTQTGGSDRRQAKVQEGEAETEARAGAGSGGR